jgi:hypothetical protein
MFENPRLRRTELGFMLFALGEYGVWLSVMVYAFQHGGRHADSLAGLVAYAGAVVAASAVTFTRPAQASALAPRLSIDGRS